jgi:hypothetical protein
MYIGDQAGRYSASEGTETKWQANWYQYGESKVMSAKERRQTGDPSEEVGVRNEEGRAMISTIICKRRDGLLCSAESIRGGLSQQGRPNLYCY